jgi:Fe2+ or Zn2+ uptake regulation protein
MPVNVFEMLEHHGIQPSAQRVAVAEYVLNTEDHPSADQVWAMVRETFPVISRATVYNTLNLFTEKGLLRELILAEGKTVFDPNLKPHHHFLDDETGEIFDIPWAELAVENVESLKGFQVREYQVVLRGRKRAEQN